MAGKRKAPPKEEAKMDLNVKDQEEFDSLWLVQALQLVHGEREQDHGHPHDTFTLVRAGWSIIAGAPLTYTQVCYMMTWHKMARELITGGREDEENNIDAIGYLGVLNRIKLKEAENEARRAAGSA